MIKKLLVICGPTGTGKTKMAIALAGKFEGELISADSRQVYREMNIGSGKDLPVNCLIQRTHSSDYGYYLINNVKVWGYDLAEITENFNVAQYSDIAGKIVKDIWKRMHLPIIVGGTGFYIKSLTDGVQTILIPPNNRLRKVLSKKSVDRLFMALNVLDEERAGSMNDSDRKNPRRLIRAIEIARWHMANKSITEAVVKLNYDSLLIIGLKAPKDFLNKRVVDRVNERIEGGFEEEINMLLKKGSDWKSQSMQGMGYRQYEDYKKSLISKEEFIRRWILEEQKYIKRQMTWFSKDKRIVWFDISKPHFKTEVENKIQNWYDKKERRL